MLRGLTTTNFYSDDVPATVAWYTDVLGVEPYFVRPLEGPPLYVEFRIGDYEHELGIISRNFEPKGAVRGTGGAVAYWHVDDVRATFATLIEKGATEWEAPVDREAGFVTASVLDPFGNILGLMYSTHYLKGLERDGRAR